MDIKKTYSYFLNENIKSTGIVYSIVVAVTLFILIFALFMGEKFVASDLINLIPNYFTVLIVSFIFGIVSNRNMDLVCNQFGKSRKTAYHSNLLVLFTISFIVAALFSTLRSFFYVTEYNSYIELSGNFNSFISYNKELFIGSAIQYVSRFAYWLYHFSYYSFISIFAITLGVFIYSLWVRLEKLYRWIVFLLIPLIIAYLIPKFVIHFFVDSNNTMSLITKFINFFGLQNGFSYKFIFVSLASIIIPLLVIAYFIMLKKPLYGKKK